MGIYNKNYSILFSGINRALARDNNRLRHLFRQLRQRSINQLLKYPENRKNQKNQRKPENKQKKRKATCPLKIKRQGRNY
jgi:hypothetical protein